MFKDLSGRLIKVEKNDVIFCYKFSRDLCTVFNTELKPGFYIVIESYESDFSAVLVDDKLLIVMNDAINNLII